MPKCLGGAGRRRGQPIYAFETADGLQSLSSKRARHLEMDHIHVGFGTFMWTHYWIATHAVYLWISGIVRLLLRQRLQRLGWISPKPCDAERVVAALLLEGVGMMLHYNGMRENGDRTLGVFKWTDFPMLNADGDFEIAPHLTIEVDLHSKRMVEAQLNGSAITASDAMTLVWFDTIFAAHVKSHSLGNWGVNLEGVTIDPYLKQCGEVTVMYNYFGKTVFRRLTQHWWRWGWCKKNWGQIEQVIDHGIKQGIPNHAGVRELRYFSEICDFVVKIRNHFLNTFEKYRKDLPGIDGEAMFVGTVLHSLDHTLMEWNLEEPLWLDVDSPRFGVMAEIGRFVLMGFVEDLPGLVIRRHYHDALMAFHKDVYSHACVVNRRFADHMDTCIVK